jgi:D-alanyl-D-alanine carboxypeptidase (penicillin-binding protein 5/6)
MSMLWDEPLLAVRVRRGIDPVERTRGLACRQERRSRLRCRTQDGRARAGGSSHYAVTRAEGPTPPPDAGGREAGRAGEHGEGTTIHLGGHRRQEGPVRDGGESAALSRTASGLSALGRAQARAHALTEQADHPPQTATRPGEPGRGPAATLRGSNASLAPSETTPPRRAPRLTAPRPARGRRPRAERRPVGLTFSGGGGRRRAGRPGRQRGGLHRSRRRSRLTRAVLVVALVAGVIVLIAGALAIVQVKRAIPRATLRTTLAATAKVNGPVPRIPWPSTGEAAVTVVGVGAVGSAGPSTRVPVASLAKVMAAVVVLHDHPLAPGQSGPNVTITAADQAIYQADVAAGDSVAPVVVGESLSELELLQALLIPSADNLAPVLATWDAGSQAAFVAKMNATATALGLHATHYADSDGIDPATVSTAADQLRLAETVVASPVLMSIVRQRQVTLPNGAPLSNYDTVLGQDGIVGIKTGSTTAAGGCFMFAADARVGGRAVQVLGVVLGQRATPLIPAALDASRALIGPVLAALRPVTALPAGAVVGEISSPWGSLVPVTTTKAVTVLHFGQLPVRLAVKANPGPLPARFSRGFEVATVTVSAGGQTQTVPAVTSQTLQGPSLRWRLERR